eukprot:scaffold165164_cov57-Attheya_sp.AAC.1
MKDCGSILNKGGREAFSVSHGTYLSTFTGVVAILGEGGTFLKWKRSHWVWTTARMQGVETDLVLSLAVLEGGLKKVEGRSTIIRSEATALSWSSFLDLLLDLALRVIKGGWVVMGTELSLRMRFDLDIQSAEGGGLGDGLEEEGGSTINRSGSSALSRSSFLDLILDDLALRVVEGGWVMGTELSLRMCFDLYIQSAEGCGLGNGGYRAWWVLGLISGGAVLVLRSADLMWSVVRAPWPGVSRCRAGERRVVDVGGFRRVVGGGSGLNIVGGPGAVGHTRSAMVWFGVGIGFHCRKR